ncbi:hypothetical protein DFH06DRAFT_1133577 [Mycena polygramma]|nr:hypothetical protein DFH06DRAFT_1133577 [Mycena polygramma]
MTSCSRSRSSSTCSASSELDELRKHTAYLRRKLQAQQLERDEHDRRRGHRSAQETKRCQWKAASARYYENHPEVREKKRQKMAAQRAAKKLSRRKWDPPKKPRLPPPHPDSSEDMALSRGVSTCPSPVPQHSDVRRGPVQLSDAACADLQAAAESLLFLQRQHARHPLSADLPPSDDILMSGYTSSQYTFLFTASAMFCRLNK